MAAPDRAHIEKMADDMLAAMRKDARDTVEAVFLVGGFHPGDADYDLLDTGINAGITACMSWFKAHGMIEGVQR